MHICSLTFSARADWLKSMVPSCCLPGSSWLGQRCLCWVGVWGVDLASHTLQERLNSFRWCLSARAAPHVAGASLASPLPNHEEGNQLLRFTMQSLPSTHCILVQNEMGLIADHRYSPFLVPGKGGGWGRHQLSLDLANSKQRSVLFCGKKWEPAWHISLQLRSNEC